MGGVEVLLLGVLGEHRVAQVGPEGLAAYGMAGEESERFDLELEVGRGALGPGGGDLSDGWSVERGVDLHCREDRRVVAQAFFSVARIAWIEVGVAQQCRI